MRALPLALLVGLLAAGPAAAEPAVTAVSAPGVKLAPGARASVTLTGTDLDQVQSAGVLKGGAPAAGVTAELGPAGKTSRAVTIVTQATAAPGRDYKLTLTGGKATLTPALVIEIAAPPTAAPAPKPAAPTAASPAPPPAPRPTAAGPPPPPPKPTAEVPPPTPKPTATPLPPAAPKSMTEAPAPVPKPGASAPTPAPPPTDPKAATGAAQATTAVAARPAAPVPPAKATTGIAQAPASGDPKPATPTPQPGPAEAVAPAPRAPAAASALKPSATLPAPVAAARPATPTTTTARVQIPAAILAATPAVSRVEPAVLALNAGSQATLVLYGQALDRLQTIAVTPARGALTAQLGPPASTMRTLTLVASSGALGGRYQLTAQAGTTSFILSAAVDVAARPAVAPVLTRLDRTADGYVLVGRGFGTDRSKVVVWEGGVRVSDFAVVGVAPDRITVRSRPTGSVMHRVEVAGVASGSLGVSHSGPVIGSIGVTSAELARILASPKAQTAGAPTPALAPSAPRPAAPQPAVPAAARPGPGGTVAPGSLAPSTPSPSPAAARAGAAAPSVAGAPRATPAPRGQGFAPRSATTSELTMTGLGPPPVVGQ